jgi:hypothetical protein
MNTASRSNTSTRRIGHFAVDQQRQPRCPACMRASAASQRADGGHAGVGIGGGARRVQLRRLDECRLAAPARSISAGVGVVGQVAASSAARTLALPGVAACAPGCARGRRRRPRHGRHRRASGSASRWRDAKSARGRGQHRRQGMSPSRRCRCQSSGRVRVSRFKGVPIQSAIPAGATPTGCSARLSRIVVPRPNRGGAPARIGGDRRRISRLRRPAEHRRRVPSRSRTAACAVPR